MAASSVMYSFRASRKVLSRVSKNTLAKVLGAKQYSHAVSYQETLGIPDPRTTTLKNRLRVATEENHSGSATVGLWVDVGSRYETASSNGATHLLEHLLFKGTPRRSQLDLETEVDNLGMNLNSYVGRDHMAIFAKCLSRDVPKAVEILSDLVQNNVFSDADIDREKHVLLNELDASGDDLTTVVMDYLHATAYQGTSLSRSVLGTTESIKSLSKKDLDSLHKTYVKPSRMVLAGAGGVSHEQLVSLGEKHFGGMSLNYDEGIPIIPPSRFTGSEIRARYDDEPLVHIAMAIEGPGAASEDNLPLQVALTLVGNYDKTFAGGKNLANRVALASAHDGLAHAFQSFNLTYQGTGLWGAYFVCDKLTVADFFFNLQGEWMRLCTSVTDSDVERAKNTLKTSLFGHLSDTTLTCDDVAKQALFLGRRVSYEEFENRLNSIDASTVRDVAYKYIYDKCPAVACYGPTEQVPDYNRVRGSMYWLRY
ncbi:hypothetical protein HELRODRAFT_96341 [Helobdella robusta]|uniref:Mitochondrial-processing peptidase subunit beta n=1 Tax=Helobdella robusta TaxID=6412 RepID=T1G9B5_HELRO|nr:hypothetical protein HELRODRAFT_96341 [Helobdella robusta]ESN91657.1 hypothetical protein HELRODRAFT_96341 [Helobdella robusta]